MQTATKLVIGVALTAWLGLAASGAATAQSYSRYASSGGYYGGTYAGGSNWMDRASQSFSGGGY